MANNGGVQEGNGSVTIFDDYLLEMDYIYGGPYQEQNRVNSSKSNGWDTYYGDNYAVGSEGKINEFVQVMNNTSITTIQMIGATSPSSSTFFPPVAVTSPALTPSRGPNIGIIAYCYILPMICFLGIVGNVMNVLTLASPKLRAVSYMYLRALAIADLLCMLFVLAFVVCEILKTAGIGGIDRHPVYGFYQTHIMLAFINWTLATGVYIVVALSLERYISVVFPLHFRIWNSPERAKKAILIAYIVPLLFYIPYGIGRYSTLQLMSDGVIVYMAIDSEASKTLSWKIYKWTREGILRFLPIIVLFVLNSQIMVAFRRRQRMFERLKKEKTGSARDETLLYILGGIAVMFFVCNIPAAINLLFINETVKKRLDYQIFRAVANLLEITNHAAQFYIFCVCSADYRITFMQKFPCFKTYYISRSKFWSFVRKTSHPNERISSTQTQANSSKSIGNTVIRHQTDYIQNHTKGSEITLAMNAKNSSSNNFVVRTVYEKDREATTNIHFASEEDLSDESEVDGLLQCNSFHPTSNSEGTSLNGTTYL